MIDKAKRITGLIEKLESGALTLTELDPLCNEARELYEQIVVLRYKAMEELTKSNIDSISGEPVPQEIPVQPEPEKQPASPGFSGFRLDLGSPRSKNELKQEAAARTKTEAKLPPRQESIPIPDQPLPFNNPEFSAPMPKQEVKKDEPEEPVRLAPNQMNLMDVINEPEDKESTSVNDQYQRSESGTLASKLGKTPIADLKSAIGINQKFLFMNNLFQGENLAYNDAIEKLNSCQTREEALEYLDKQLSEQFNWDVDDEHVGEFRELIERRYL